MLDAFCQAKSRKCGEFFSPKNAKESLSPTPLSCYSLRVSNTTTAQVTRRQEYCENNRKFSDQVNRMKADKWEQIDEYTDMIVGAGDPIDALMSYEEELMDKMGWDTYLELNKDKSEDWSMQ